MFRDHHTQAGAATVAFAVLVVGLVLGGCQGSGTGTGALAPPTDAATTSSSTTTSTVPPTTVFHPSAPQLSQDQAASHLVAAWKANDRAAAAADATGDAIAVVFARPFPPGGIQARGCSTPVAGPSYCVFRVLADGSLLELSAVTGSGGGWLVSAARFET